MDLKLAFVVVAICGFGTVMAGLKTGFCPTFKVTKNSLTWDQMRGWWYAVKGSDDLEKKCQQFEVVLNGSLLNITRYYTTPKDGLRNWHYAFGKIPPYQRNSSRIQLYTTPERTNASKKPYAYLDVLFSAFELAIVRLCRELSPDLRFAGTYVLSRNPNLDFNKYGDTIRSIIREYGLGDFSEFFDIIQDCGKANIF